EKKPPNAIESSVGPVKALFPHSSSSRHTRRLSSAGHAERGHGWHGPGTIRRGGGVGHGRAGLAGKRRDHSAADASTPAEGARLAEQIRHGRAARRLGIGRRNQVAISS